MNWDNVFTKWQEFTIHNIIHNIHNNYSWGFRRVETKLTDAPVYNKILVSALMQTPRKIISNFESFHCSKQLSNLDLDCSQLFLLYLKPDILPFEFTPRRTIIDSDFDYQPCDLFYKMSNIWKSHSIFLTENLAKKFHGFFWPFKKFPDLVGHRDLHIFDLKIHWGD